MQVDFDRLMKYYEAGKLRHSVHPEGRNLHVWCYSVSTVYSRDWDDLTILCRGLVTDSEGFVVSRPFPKFFNWGEPGAPSDLSRPFLAYDKMDGSLIVVGHDKDGETVVSTKGSFSTWHSERARQLLGTFTPKAGMTAVFEFIDPRNRIVIDYGDMSGLVLLGAVDHETGEDHFTPDDVADTMEWYGEVVVSRNFNMGHMLHSVSDPANGENKEGFVVVYPEVDKSSERVKLKFAQYVNLHRMLSRLNNVAVWEALYEGTLDALLDVVPDELFDKVRECADELNQEHERVMGDAAEVVREVAGLPTRKAQAEVVVKAENSSLVFHMLDVRYDLAQKAAWLIVKPSLDREWAFLR